MKRVPLELFSSAFTALLRNQIDRNLSLYGSDSVWALGFRFDGAKTIGTKLLHDEDAALILPDDATKNNDAQNAVLIHKEFAHLTPAQATDERLWTALTHTVFWNYMRRRWPIERFEDREKASRFILSRYFVPQAQGRALLRNGIARLWWAAHLTHDKTREEPYELTSVLLSRLDITQQILERSIGRADPVLKGFLDFLRINSQRFLEGGQKSRGDIRLLAKFLNLAGGVTILDSLRSTDITKILEGELARVDAAPSQEAVAQ